MLINRVKVKFAEPIAVLADPKPKDVLDQKYKTFEDNLKSREKPPSAGTIRALIEEKKLADRYSEKPLGFARDMAWKIGDEAMINEELARKWQDAGICNIVDETNGSKSSKAA